MATIFILSHHPSLADRWKNLINPQHECVVVNDGSYIQALILPQSVSLLVVDGESLNSDHELLQLKNLGLKILLIGRNWSEDRQITLLVAGIAGYCEQKATDDTLLNAVNSILQGDIWVYRHLVPRIIETLISNNARKPILQNSASEGKTIKLSLQSLTHRELDVAKMIRNGENNKRIAAALNISERTVKAHLTSIFQKLQVSDRMRLALLLKELP